MGINNMKHSWLKKHKPKQLKVQDSLVSEIHCYILASNLITLQKESSVSFPRKYGTQMQCSTEEQENKECHHVLYFGEEKTPNYEQREEKRADN